jgi:hypothetical protein
MAKKFNYIYSTLVESEDDFIGKIAYTIYKEDKIKFIAELKKDNSEKEITEKDLIQFHQITSTEKSIYRYRLTAQSILQEFLNVSLREAIEDVTEEIQDNHINLLENVVSKIKPPKFWKSVWQNVVASFVLSAIIALFIIIITFTIDGFWGTIGRYFNLDIRPKTEVTTPKK